MIKKYNFFINGLHNFNNITLKILSSNFDRYYRSEPTHFPERNNPARNDAERTGYRGETTRYQNL